MRKVAAAAEVLGLAALLAVLAAGVAHALAGDSLLFQSDVVSLATYFALVGLIGGLAVSVLLLPTLLLPAPARAGLVRLARLGALAVMLLIFLILAILVVGGTFGSATILKLVRSPEDFVAEAGEMSKQFKQVGGTSRIRSQLNRARKAIRAKKPSPEKAEKALNRAMELYEEDVAWRTRAAKELKPGIDAYGDQIKDTIGLRLLPRLPEEQSLYVASCNSGHRDISLNF